MGLAATLIKSGADKNAKTVFGVNLLHAAAESHDLANITAALQLGVDPNIKNSFNQTPLAIIINKKPLNMPAAAAIIRAGGDPNSKTTFGENLLHAAVDSNSYANIKLAVKLGVDPNAKDSFGKTALQRVLGKVPVNKDAVALLSAPGSIRHTPTRTHSSVSASPTTRSTVPSASPAPSPTIHKAPAPRATTQASAPSRPAVTVDPHLLQPTTIVVQQPFKLDSLINRPESGRLICEYIDKNTLNFDQLDFLRKSRNARELVLDHIKSLSDEDEKLRLVTKCRDIKTGLGYFFNTKKNMFEFNNPFPVQLEQLQNEMEAKRSKATSIPSQAPALTPSSYAVMHPSMSGVPSTQPAANEEASAPPMEEVLQPQLYPLTDAYGKPFMPQFDFVKETKSTEAPPAVEASNPVVSELPLLNPEDEKADEDIPATKASGI
jgi:hypothetical protein